MFKKLTSKLPVIFCFLVTCLFVVFASACSSGKKSKAESQKSTSYNKFSLYLKGDNLYMARYNNSEIIDLGPCTTNGSVMEKFSITEYSKDTDLFCSFADYDGKTYTLYTSTSKSPTKRTKVVYKVTVHSILKNSDILYLSNKELFLYKGGKKENDGLLYTAKILGNDYNSLFIDKNIVIQNLGKYSSHTNLVSDDTGTYIIYNNSLPEISSGRTDTYHIWENGKDTVIAENVKDYNVFLSYYNKFEIMLP